MFSSHLRRLVYVSTHVFILASSIPTEAWPSECSSSSPSSSCPGSPERGSSRGTRAVQVEMALSSSSNARYKGTWRAISSTAERQGGYKVKQNSLRTRECLYWREHYWLILLNIDKHYINVIHCFLHRLLNRISIYHIKIKQRQKHWNKKLSVCIFGQLKWREKKTTVSANKEEKFIDSRKLFSCPKCCHCKCFEGHQWQHWENCCFTLLQSVSKENLLYLPWSYIICIDFRGFYISW